MYRFVAVVFALTATIVMPGCGSGHPSNEAENSATSIAATKSPQVRSASVSGIVLDLKDTRGLTWTSSVIVQGTVERALPPQRFPATNGPLGTQTSQQYYDSQIYTDYIVRVSKTYRGEYHDSVTVRELGGTVDGFTLTVDQDEYPPMTPGDDVVLFLVPTDKSQPNGTYWVTGVGQGFWRVKGQQVVPTIPSYPTLQVDQVGQKIANALSQGPPQVFASISYSLAEAPPGPDLPSIATPIAP
jgi:hypothetical protein